MLNFRDCTLTQLEETFGVKQVRQLDGFESWLNGSAEISEMETAFLQMFREKLILNVHDWNETELAYNFIGPIMAMVNYTTEYCNFFAERLVSGVVEGIEMSGKPDGMIASGFREPKTPYFCFQEYKKDQDPEGDPAGQVLAAMLVAQELNGHHLPVYGCYVKGRDWSFTLLRGKEYAISEPYIATRNEISDIFRILKQLKHLLPDFVAQSHSGTESIPFQAQGRE